jgi:hypothetical protein
LNREHVVNPKLIHKSYTKRPTTQYFSSLADTRAIDFSKNQTRDDVSFLKKLARVAKAKELNLEPDHYSKLLRLAKTKRFDIVINKEKGRGKSATKRAGGVKESIESLTRERKHSSIK